MKKFIVLILSMGVLFSAGAQEKKSYKKGHAVGVHFTLHDFNTAADLKNMSLSSIFEKGEWYRPRNMNPGFALSYTKGILENMDVMVRLGMTSLEYPRPGTQPNAFKTSRTMLESDVNLNIKLLSDKYIVSPFVSLGAGASVWNSYYAAYFPVGLGLQVNLFDEVYGLLQSQYRFPITANANNHLFYSFGMGTTVGKKKEVAPAPLPPLPVVVEKPKDTDGDGIPDKDDACPTVAGIAKFKGCPDSDNDGVPDAQDKCPTVAGIARFNGCPDTDEDGIQDAEDKCPTVAGFARYQGCPIPDTDADGVNDEDDKCPTIAGVADNAGCPRIEFDPNSVQFLTGSATLTKGAKIELDKLTKILNEEHKNIRINIEGHTDNVGNAASNQALSEKRAAAVKAYLVGNKVDADRLATAGYGQDKPLGDNATAQGRIQNRRVEFKVSQY
jgi:outer membrane protein OmpA-like peptidoglycan-associated protein